MLLLLVGLGVLVAAVLAYYAWFIEPYSLRVSSLAFEVNGLDPSAGKITILHLSDLHMRAGEERKARMIESLKRLSPDLVVITGDFVQSTSDARYCAEVIGCLRAKHGVIGVLGNHDHFRYNRLSFLFRTPRIDPSKGKANSIPDIVKTLEDGGIKILVNSNLRFEINGQDIWIVGVDDPYHFRDDLPKALEGVPLESARLLLAHSPDIVDKAVEHGIELILSGHTHGGQVRLPIVGAVVTRTKTRLERPSGVIRRNGTTMYISRGIGGGTLTLRFMCPPQATIIELRPASGRGAPTTEQQSSIES